MRGPVQASDFEEDGGGIGLAFFPAGDAQAESGRGEHVGLADRLHFRPGQLSGGQQQRVAIVRALANDPVLVLADEPTGNLDSKSGHAVFALMRDLNRTTGKAFLLVTHDAAFAAGADRVVRLVDGRIAA